MDKRNGMRNVASKQRQSLHTGYPWSWPEEQNKHDFDNAGTSQQGTV